MSSSHCTLVGQLRHGVEHAVLVLAIGILALGLDLFATVMVPTWVM